MRDQAPSVRVGINHGPALERDGDYLGATVNVAARVSALAKGGEVLLTGRTAALVPDLDDIYFESRGRQELRNVREPVELFAAIRMGTRTERFALDPVCNMVVDPDRAGRPARVRGQDVLLLHADLRRRVRSDARALCRAERSLAEVATVPVPLGCARSGTDESCAASVPDSQPAATVAAWTSRVHASPR